MKYEWENSCETVIYIPQTCLHLEVILRDVACLSGIITGDRYVWNEHVARTNVGLGVTFVDICSLTRSFR